MSKLTDQLIHEAGLTVEQAEKAVRITTGYLQSKFPKIFHPEIENLLNDKELGNNFKEQLRDFGNKAEETAKTVAQKTDELITETGEKLREMFSGKKNN